jgi:hypothetical protein
VTVDELDLRLDGNAAGGLLMEVFGTEMTAADETCASCGAVNAIGAVLYYANAPGAILRCPACTALLICIVRTPDGMVVDLSGIRRIRM